MIPTYQNYLLSSFLLYLDNKLLTKGAAFTNYSGQLYPINKQTFSGLYIYSSPYSEWVSDISIPNAQVPTNIFINNVPTNIGQSGLIAIDQINGRAYFNVPVNGTVTAAYSIKDINITFPVTPRIETLFDKKFELRPKINQTLSGLGPDQIPYPVGFIKQSSSKNTPLAIGGLDETTNNISVYFFLSSQMMADAVAGICTDLKYDYMPLLGSGDMPYGPYNNFLNNIPFNYTGLTSGRITSNSGVLIKNVEITDYNRHIYANIENLTPNCYFIVAEFELIKDRLTK